MSKSKLIIRIISGVALFLMSIRALFYERLWLPGGVVYMSDSPNQYWLFVLSLLFISLAAIIYGVFNLFVKSDKKP